MRSETGRASALGTSNCFRGCLGALAISLLTLALISDASAQRRRSTASVPTGASIGGLVGGAADIGGRRWGRLNPYGLGLGGRIGYTLSPTPLYLGGRLMFNLGDSAYATSIWSWQLGGEIGYDIGAGPLVIRPYMGIGAANFHWDCGRYCGDSYTELYLAPSVAFLVPINRLFLGGDLNFLFVTDAPNAIGMYFTIGTYL